ncbi:MAG: hypothetical protein KGL34_07465 [Gammaproteobacteria bacterium]|nr:hypothetical protein [Gammaproteobacteria bacterium]
MTAFLWLLRRETWEHRSIWIAPGLLAALMVLAALFGHAELSLPAAAAHAGAVGGAMLLVFGLPFLLAMIVHSTWYLLDCLHAERRDRSVLYWKALPLGDAITVLSKLVTAVLLIPMVYFATADATTLLIAFIVSLRTHTWLGVSLWRADLWLQLQALWLYLIVTMGIWYLPVSAWLLLVSAWARRAVTLWSILPPLALAWLERGILHSGHVAAWLATRRPQGYLSSAFHDLAGSLFAFADSVGGAGKEPRDVWMLLAPGRFLAMPSTWIGAAAGGALVYAAIRVRRREAES